MTTNSRMTRRGLIAGAAAGAAMLPMGAALAQKKPLVIGFIYVGPRDDYGYNQAHAEGAAILKKMAGVKVLEEEKVPETVAVQKSMESMIGLDGATLMFPTSFARRDRRRHYRPRCGTALDAWRECDRQDHRRAATRPWKGTGSNRPSARWLHGSV